MYLKPSRTSTLELFVKTDKTKKIFDRKILKLLLKLYSVDFVIALFCYITMFLIDFLVNGIPIHCEWKFIYVYVLHFVTQRSSQQRWPIKRDAMLLRTSQNSQENTSAGVSVLVKLLAALKKETLIKYWKNILCECRHSKMKVKDRRFLEYFTPNIYQI